MEHIARGTIGKPDLLLSVSDPGARGLRTVARIREIAVQLGLEPEKITVVFNRYRTGTATVDTGLGSPIAVIPFDDAVENADLAATPVSAVPEESRARKAVRVLAEKIRDLAVDRNSQ
jgi:CO dehydrogenase maturation factor